MTVLLGGFRLLAQENATNAQDRTTSSAGNREDLARVAGKMLEETDEARTAIKNHNLEAARQHVNRAQADLKKIEARAKGTTMIPVYQEFVSVSILAPVETEQAARRSNAQPASTANAHVAAGKKAVAHEVSGIYTSAFVSTTVAKNSLAAAEAALSKGDLATADAALADVQEGVQIRSDKADMPLEKAREDLVLARSSVRRGKYDEAQAALRSASEALSEYAAAGGPHAQGARALQQEIENYAQGVQQNHTGVVAKINSWWNTTADWSPYRNG
ncbi:MAG TPA: YfdX family protein [Bryobacteraceae bacterium]|jgi:hypothetical protein|nr:YfdX family protein [Bryobacteraceae bacterium]